MTRYTCRSGGILPEDRAAELHRDQLRKERQEEYRAFLKQQSPNKFRGRTVTDSTSSHVETTNTNSYLRPSSVAEKRRALAQERQQELLSHRKPTLQYPPTQSVDDERETIRERDNRHSVWPDRGGGYDVKDGHQCYSGEERFNGLRAREWEAKDEREYSEGVGTHSHNPRRQRWVGRGVGGVSQRQVHFDHDYNHDDHQMKPGNSQRRRWDEEEEDLMQWARGQGKSKGPAESRPPSSPTHLSQNNVRRVGGSRSLSAPVVGGIAGLGAGSSERDKKSKQREYAEQLRAQMREKQAAKERERDGIAFDTHSESRHHQQTDRTKPSPSHRHSYNNAGEHNSRAFPPRRRERVHFTPERTTHFEPESTSSKPPLPGHPPPFQPYWPGMYYGGYPPPPPAANFPPIPPPQNGLPYYPPPLSLPPSLNNPYLSPYLPPHYHHADSAPQATQDRGSNGRFSPRKDMDETGVEEELKFVLQESDDNHLAKAKKDSYRLQLMEQMRQRNENKQRERLERREFERKKEQEVYDPFGKGGCGAPIRDKRGQLVTDLQQMKKVNDERMITGLPSTTPLPGDIAEGGAAGILVGSINEQNSSYEFRRSKELRSRSVQEDYKQTLEQQMREREEIKRREKERKSEADRLEKERIERECEALEEKYRREREKEKELKMRNEALKREEEEREKEERKREEEWRQQEALKLEAEKKKQAFIDNMERQLPVEVQPRSSSPPIPALRNPATQNQPQLQQQRQLSTSPPVPTIHHQQVIASNNRGDGGRQEYPGIPPQQEPQTNLQLQRTSTATIRPLDSEKLEQLQRSLSAHAAVPQPAGVTGGSGRDGVNVVGSSHSTQHLPSPQHPAGLIPQSISEPHPSSSGLSVVPKHAAHGAPEEHVMENLLRNLHSVRRKLETERQKVIAPKEPEQSTTPSGDANAEEPPMPVGGTDSKPGFLKARLAGHRKNKPTPTQPRHPPASESRVPQQSRENRGEDKPKRKQWKFVPTDGCCEDEDHYSGGERNPPISYQGHAPYNTQRRGEEDRRQPPSWLRPRLPRDHDPASRDFPQISDAHRPPSIGGESQFSVATLDVDGMARRNEERMRRLESILNSQARDSRTPQSILSDFLASNTRSRNHNPTNRTDVSSSPTRPPFTFTPLEGRESRTSQELDYPVAASTPR